MSKDDLPQPRSRDGTRVIHVNQSKPSRPAAGFMQCVTAPARDPLAAARAYREAAAELWSNSADGNARSAVLQWKKALAAAVEERGRVPESELDEFEGSLHSNLAAGHLKLQEYADAREHASAAVWMNPACPKARYRLGEAAIGMGSWQEAEDAVQQLEAAQHHQAAGLLRRSLRAGRRDAHKKEKAIAALMLGGPSQQDADGVLQLDLMD